MRKLAAVVAAVILILAARGIAGWSPATEETDPLISKSKAMLDALAAGDFAAAARDFDATMLKLSGPDKLAEFWKGVPANLGAFRRQTAARRAKEDPFDVVFVTCEFAKATLDAKVVFDREGKVAGFFFVPSLPPAEPKLPAYADPALFAEREVTAGVPDWPLGAVLTVPKGNGPFPGLVLVHGSGPNDKDETIGPNKPFRDLAWGLACRGIAVLRYEKRTKVYGTKYMADPKLLASMTVLEETVDDALAGLDLLAKAPEVAPGRVFLLGHSLGGMLVPRIALAPGGEKAAGFVIMAGLTRPVGETYLRQMTYLLALDGSLSDDDKSNLAEIKGQLARLKSLTEADAEKGERILNASARYWIDLEGYAPAEAVLKVRAPLLVLQGSRDYQVTTEDFEGWKKALAGRPNVVFRLYPKLNHLFIEGAGIPTPAEYTQKAGNVSAEVIEDIAAWIKR
jgi:dienelactone hydrolase